MALTKNADEPGNYDAVCRPGHIGPMDSNAGHTRPHAGDARSPECRRSKKRASQASMSYRYRYCIPNELIFSTFAAIQPAPFLEKCPRIVVRHAAGAVSMGKGRHGPGARPIIWIVWGSPQLSRLQSLQTPLKRPLQISPHGAGGDGSPGIPEPGIFPRAWRTSAARWASSIAVTCATIVTMSGTQIQTSP
jgi:hypothetical protein